jgi:uncharacterized protein (TIGR02145 family)
LSISLLEDNGGLVESISQPASSDQTGTPGCKTFTVTFKDNVESLVTGSGYSVKLLASYINKNGQAKLADMDISVQDGLCGCPAKISSSNWLTFACHNLGGLDILSSTQTIGREHHGDWYRWGAPTASVQNLDATADAAPAGWNYEGTPGATPPYTPYYQDYQTYGSGVDWLTANNPCPAGWRLPDNNEFTGLRNNNSWPTASGWSGFNAVRKVSDYLYLPAVGGRNNSDGSLNNRGSYGTYWSSSADTSYGRYVDFGSVSQSVHYSDRSCGFSVRCVAAE